MSKFTIKTKADAVRCIADSVEYHGQMMGERFLSVTVKSAAPVAFASGDYIMYRGERFELTKDTTALKKARANTYGEGFVYDSIKFVSVAHETKECDFNDYVSYDNKIHFSSLTAFSFFCSTVRDLADRIQANLNRIYGSTSYPNDTAADGGDSNNSKGLAPRGDGGWRVYVHGSIQTDPDDSEETDGADNEIKRDISLSVSGLTCWDALLLVKEKFGTVFEVRGRNIYIGYEQDVIDFTYRYGKRQGLYEIEKSVDAEQKIITRLKGYGSTRNLPMRYYANLVMYAYGTVTGTPDIDIDSTAGTALGSIALNLKWDANMFKRKLEYETPTRGNLPPDAYCVTVGVAVGNGINECNGLVLEGADGYTLLSINGFRSNPDYTYNDDTYDRAAAFLNNVSTDTQIRFVGGIYKDKFPTNNKNYGTENLPNNLAVQNLMLPGFPITSLATWVHDNVGYMSGSTFTPAPNPITGERFDIIKQAVIDGYTFSADKNEPYILSPNHVEFGIRESSTYFDGSADDQPEIFPTISGTDYDAVTSADTIADNGIYPEGTEVANFKIWITTGINFNVADAFQEGMTIAFNSGYCGGRSFQVSSVINEGSNVYRLNVKRSYDSALDLWFPYEYGDSQTAAYQISAGDKFVLLDIELPQAYVEENAITLLAASIEYLRKYDHTRYTYQPKIDEIMMAYERDESSSSSSSSDEPLYMQLMDGAIIKAYDEDLDIDISMPIDTLTIRENGNAQIPTYDVVLKEDETEGLLKELSKKVDYLAGTSGGNTSKSSSGGGEDTFWEEYIDPATGNRTAKLKDKYAGAWSPGFLSALGMSAGGGGGVTLNEPLESINNSGLSAPGTNENGKTIVWNNSTGKWEYGSTGGGGSSSLSGLSDVQLGTLSDGNVLAYDSTAGKWVNNANFIKNTGNTSLSGTFSPSSSGGANLGSSSNRFDYVYAVNGVFSTSLKVGNKDVATQSWVEGKNYLTSAVTGITAGTGLSGGTITSSGTISLADTYGDTKNPYGTKTKNYVLAGPTSGSAATPSFRALVSADIPSLSWSKITSDLPTTLSGYGITDAMLIKSLATTDNIDTLYDAGSYRFAATAQGTWPTGVTANYGEMLVVHGGGDTVAQMFFPYNSSAAYIRNGNPVNGGSWQGWKQLVTPDMNVASATKLETSRTLWGQSFNGTANVSGHMTGVGNITMSGYLFMDNNTQIQMKDSNGTQTILLTLNTGNTFALGYGPRIAGYQTDIQGENINFAVGQSSRINAMNITDTGMVHIQQGTQGLRIGDGLITWDSANNALKITKHDGTAINMYSLGGLSALGVWTGSNGDITVTGVTATGDIQGVNLIATTKVTSPKFYFDSTRYLELYAFSPASGVTVRQLRFYDGENYKVVKFE